MRIELANRRSLREFVIPGKSGRDLIIPREMEKQFFEVNGDTRAGKSTLIRKMVKDIKARGETCIFVDPKCEFVRENYRPERGDMILNFMDDRVYRWLIEREAMSEAGFKAVSVGMLPAKEHEQPWFNEHAQSIIAYLLNRWRAEINCQNLGRWLAEDKKDANGDTELDRRVAGSEHAITLAKDAPGQRSGVRGTLSKIGNLLRMCPTPDEGRPEWSVRDWAEGDRKGWIFITCTAETKDALLPLMTLWLDMFLLALQSGERRPDQKRTWVIIDELTVLQRVPKLPEALMLNAAGDNPIVLGFQSMSMVQKIYGHDQAEAMLSQSYTRFILRAREPRTAEHSSKVIGTHSVEKITATKSKQGISYSTHEAEDPLVRPRDIQTLRNMRGYFVHGDMVVKIRFKRDKFVDIAPGWIERKVLEVEEPEPIIEELPPSPIDKEKEEQEKEERRAKRVEREAEKVAAVLVKMMGPKATVVTEAPAPAKPKARKPREDQPELFKD